MFQKLAGWMRRHPIEAFFLLAIAIVFAFLFPAMLIVPKNTMFGQILGFIMARIAAFSPVIAGIIVTRVTKPQRQIVTLSRRLSIFIPSWLITIIIHTASLRLTASPGASMIKLILISAPVALLPALVITMALSGNAGVREMLATLVRPKGRIAYYLVALLTFPFIHIVGTGITNVLKGDAWFPQANQGAGLAYTIFITFLSVLFFSGGINEESGWRGFAQKRLQGRYSPLAALLMLWFLMVIWHIPNDIVQYKNGGYLLIRFALYPFITFLLGWIYNRTNGSILAVAIFHASMNSMNPLIGIFPITTAGNIMLVGFAVIVVVFDRMWHRLPGHHPAAHQE